jgi:hypothetical protein
MANALSAISDAIMMVNSRGPMDFFAEAGEVMLRLWGSSRNNSTR